MSSTNETSSPFSLTIARFGESSFTVRELRGKESSSRPWKMVVTATCSSANGVEVGAALGMRAVVSIHTDDTPRVFRGVVSAVVDEGLRDGDRVQQTRFTIVPPLALLGLQRGSRIFQDVRVDDVLRTVLGAAQIQAVFRLSNPLPERPYVTQYRETRRRLPVPAHRRRDAHRGGDSPTPNPKEATRACRQSVPRNIRGAPIHPPGASLRDEQSRSPRRLCPSPRAHRCGRRHVLQWDRRGAKADSSRWGRSVQPWADAHALPKYASAYVAFKLLDLQVFTTNQIDFHLQEMIESSVNASAAACIHAVGYGFLNGALEAAGLFDASTSNGLWLAGDYTQTYPAYRVPTVNDKDGAQNATVIALARLYTAIADRRLVGPRSCEKMLALFALAVAKPECWIDAGLSSDFKVTATKVGLGPLKSKTDVYSECSIIQHDSGLQFVVAWQNLQWVRDNGLNWICRVVQDTMRRYLP